MEIPSPLSSILPFGSATSQTKGQPSLQFKLPLGQLLKATVVDSVKDQFFTLDINGSKFSVQTKAPLSVGQQLQLQVMNQEPQIELKIVSNTVNRFVGQSLTLIGQNIDLSALFQTLGQLNNSPLDSLSSQSRSILESFFNLQQTNIDHDKGGSTLKQLLENIGFQFERHLASGDKNAASNTLKAALLEIAQIFKDSESITSGAQKLLTTIELFQLTHLQSSNNDFIIFPLPFPFLQAGFLQIARDDSNQNNNENNEYRFTLNVTMSELGHMNIDFVKSKETVLIRIRAESEEKMAFLQQFEDELKSKLSASKNISVSFAADAEDPAQSLLKRIVTEGGQMLNTRA